MEATDRRSGTEIRIRSKVSGPHALSSEHKVDRPARTGLVPPNQHIESGCVPKLHPKLLRGFGDPSRVDRPASGAASSDIQVDCQPANKPVLDLGRAEDGTGEFGQMSPNDTRHHPRPG